MTCLLAVATLPYSSAHLISKLAFLSLVVVHSFPSTAEQHTQAMKSKEAKTDDGKVAGNLAATNWEGNSLTLDCTQSGQS